MSRHVTGCRCTIGWKRCWRRLTSSCRVWFPTCCAPVPGAAEGACQRGDGPSSPGHTRRLTPARDPRTVEGCTRRMPRTESCLPSAAEGGAGGAGTDRETDWPPGAGDGRPASPYQDPVERLAEVPGLGVDS